LPKSSLAIWVISAGVKFDFSRSHHEALFTRFFSFHGLAISCKASSKYVAVSCSHRYARRKTLPKYKRIKTPPITNNFLKSQTFSIYWLQVSAKNLAERGLGPT